MVSRFAGRAFLPALIPAWSLAVALSASAATLNAAVTDDQGKPVADAVVWATPLAPAPAPTRRAPVAILDQQNREFIPYVLPVEVGTSITFPNNDNIRHHVYSFSPARKFELPLYSGVPAAPVLFATPGTVVLGCNIHDWMLAYVQVVSTPYFARTGAGGDARLPGLPTGAYEVRVWHPRLKGAPEATAQRVTLAATDAGQLGFVIALGRDRRIPRPPLSHYDPRNSP